MLAAALSALLIAQSALVDSSPTVERFEYGDIRFVRQTVQGADRFAWNRSGTVVFYDYNSFTVFASRTGSVRAQCTPAKLYGINEVVIGEDERMFIRDVMGGLYEVDASSCDIAWRVRKPMRLEDHATSRSALDRALEAGAGRGIMLRVPNAPIMLTTDARGILEAWDTEAKRRIAVIDAIKGEIQKMIAGGGNTATVLILSSGQIKELNVATWKVSEVHTPVGPWRDIGALADGGLILVAEGGRIAVRDGNDGRWKETILPMKQPADSYIAGVDRRIWIAEPPSLWSVDPSDMTAKKLDDELISRFGRVSVAQDRDIYALSSEGLRVGSLGDGEIVEVGQWSLSPPHDPPHIGFDRQSRVLFIPAKPQISLDTIAATEVSFVDPERAYPIQRTSLRSADGSWQVSKAQLLTYNSMFISGDRFFFGEGAKSRVSIVESTGLGRTGAVPLPHLQVLDFDVSRDGRLMAVGADEGVAVVDVATRSMIKWRGNMRNARAVRLFDDKLHVLYVAEYLVWDLESDATTTEKTDIIFPAIGRAEIIDESRYVALEDGKLLLCDRTARRCADTQVTALGAVAHISSDPARSTLVASMMDGSLVYLNIDTGDTVRIVHDGEEWFMHDRHGRMTGSLGADRIVRAAVGNKTLRPSQLPSLWAPAQVLSLLGGQNRDLQNFYEKRVSQRRQEVGLLPGARLTSQGLPTADLSMRVHEPTSAVLRMQCGTLGAELGRVQLYRNTRPLLGEFGAGTPIRGHAWSDELRLELAPGLNEISLGCFDTHGFEGPRDSVRIIGKPRAGNLLFVGIGVGTHTDRRIAKLQFVANDVNAVSQQFKSMGFAYDSVTVKTYSDAEFTDSALREILEMTQKLGVSDTFVLYLAGHGINNPVDMSYYFLTTSSDLDRIAETALPWDKIEKLLYPIKAEQKLLLLDTCNSGVTSGESAGEGSLTARALFEGVLAGSISKDMLESGNQEYLFEHNRLEFADLVSRSGTVVLSSSHGFEASYEAVRLNHGVFTSALLQALTTSVADADYDGWIEGQDLFSVIRDSVVTSTRGLQHPAMERGNLLGEIRLPISRGIRRSGLKDRTLSLSSEKDRRGMCAHGTGSDGLLLIICLGFHGARRRRHVFYS